jgi:hypothetical protein
MNWHCIVFGWGLPLGIWFAARVYARRRGDAPVPNQQGLQRGPAVFPKPEHRRQNAGAASKKNTPGISWHCAIKLYIGQRMGALVSREAPEPQPIQQVPRRTRRQLSQGVGREGFYDHNRNGTETLPREQAERERLAHDRVTEIGTHNKDR